MTLQIYNDKPTEYLTESWFFSKPAVQTDQTLPEADEGVSDI